MRRSGSIALPDWAAGAGLLVALLLVYSAVLVTPYAVTDDYVHLAGAMRDGRFTFEISMARGCPTSALLSWLGFLAADSLSALRYLRVVGLVGLGLLAYLLYLALRRAGWRPGLAAALTLIICTTPPFQVFASWAVAFTAFHSCALTGLACQQGLRALEPGVAALRVATALGLLAVTVWQPLESFASGLGKTVEWYLARTDWTAAILSGAYQQADALV